MTLGHSILSRRQAQSVYRLANETDAEGNGQILLDYLKSEQDVEAVGFAISSEIKSGICALGSILDSIAILSERDGGLPIAFRLAVQLYEKTYTPKVLLERDVIAGKEAVEVLFDELLLALLRKHDFEAKNGVSPQLNETIRRLEPIKVDAETTSHSNAASEPKVLRRRTGMPAKFCLLRSRQYLYDMKKRGEVYAATRAACPAHTPTEIVEMIFLEGLKLVGVPSKREAEQQQLWEPKETLLPERLDHPKLVNIRQFFTGWCVDKRKFKTFRRHYNFVRGICLCTGFKREFYLHEVGGEEPARCLRVYDSNGGPSSHEERDELDRDLKTGVVEIWEKDRKTLKDTCLFFWSVWEFYEWQNALLLGVKESERFRFVKQDTSTS